jgi:hypothetical protein
MKFVHACVFVCLFVKTMPTNFLLLSYCRYNIQSRYVHVEDFLFYNNFKIEDLQKIAILSQCLH